MSQLLETILSTQFFYSVFRVTTPILFASLGSLIAARAGVTNIGLEGCMLFSALAGVITSAITQSAFVGLLCAVLCGMLLSLVIAYFALELKTDIILAGTAINLFASGGTIFILYLFTGDRGVSTSLKSMILPSVDLPLIRNIPILGDIISGQNILTYLAFIAVAVIYVLLYRTKLGLRIRSVGENPSSAASVGIKVKRVQYIAMAICGILCGLGGAYMSMAYLPWFSKDMVAGRGFIALAAQTMGASMPVKTMFSALLFGVADTLSNSMQKFQIPGEFIQMIPYVSTIIGLCIYSRSKVTEGKKMKKRDSRALSILLAVVMVVSLLVPSSMSFAAESETTITILHTNDTHGAGAEVSKSAFSYAQIATLAQEITPRPILLDAGDIVEGGVFASETEGLFSINAMRMIGYDAVTLGNHEFNRFRSETISRLTDASGDGLLGKPIALVNANVTGAADLETLPAYTILEREGIRVGVFGLTTTSTKGTANPNYCKGLEFENSVAAAQRTVDAINALPAAEKPHVIVGLVHLGFEGSKNGSDDDFSNAVAANVDGIDLIIDGHAHQVMLGEGAEATNAQTVNGTKIVSTGSSLGNIGKVEITVTANGTVSSVVSSGYTAGEDAIEEEATVKAYLDRVVDSVNNKLGQTFASTEYTLYGGKYANGSTEAQICRRGETNLISLIADAKKYACEQVIADAGDALAEFELDGLSVVAMQCGGGVRNSISAGDITYRDVSNLYISGGTTGGGYYVKTKGSVVWEIVEWGLSCLIEQDAETGAIIADGNTHGRFPNFAGLRYSYDITQPGSTPTNWDGTGEMTMGSRVTGIWLDDGTEITKDSDQWLVLVTSEYEMSGGDNYYCLQNAKERGDLVVISENGPSYDVATVQYIEKLYNETGTVYYPLQSGRIMQTGGVYTKETFQSVITLKTTEETLAGQRVSMYANYGLAGGAAWESLGSYTTNQEGQITLSLKNGPQELKAVVEQDGVSYESVMYVDNYAGLLNSTHSFTLPEVAAEPEAPVETPAEAPVTPATPAEEKPTGEIAYVVVPGDNLTRIANRYGTTWQVLAKYNKLKNPNLIYPNQIILIPAA